MLAFMNDTNSLQTFPGRDATTVLVAGAGISGLSSAWHLAQEGVAVRVYEAASRVGGKIMSLEADGASYEGGPNTLLADGAQLEWLASLGLSVEYPSKLSKKRYVLQQGRYRPLPAGPVSFLFGDFFSWRAKAKILSEPWRRNAPASDAETVADFIRRRLGGEVLDKAVNPFVGGVFAGDPEKLLVGETLGLLARAEREAGSITGGMWRRARAGALRRRDTYSLKGGLESLPRALARGLDVRLGCPVMALERDADGTWWVETGNARVHAEKVVLALPAYAAARLLENVDAAAAEALAAVRYAPMTVVVSRIARADLTRPLEGFGGLNPACEGAFAAGHLMTGALYPGRCAEDEVLVTSFVGGEQYAANATLADDALLASLNAELSSLLGLTGTPRAQHVVRWPAAIAQGSSEVLAVREASARLATQGVYLCASYLDGVSVPDCIGKGRRLAGTIADELVVMP